MKNLSIILTAVFVFLSISTIDAQSREDKKERKKHKTEKTVKRNKAVKNNKVVKHNKVHKVKRSKVVYVNRKPAVRAVRTLPNARVIMHNNRRYHYSNGRYYRFVGGKYIIATPPRYLRVRTLPVGFVRVLVGPKPYFYHGGIYYSKVVDTDEYEIIDAPQDAIIYTLPEDAEELSIDGERFFESYGTLYKVVTTPDGKAFKVAGQLED